ncbi:lasso peptide biosynthesis B2 protein [Brevundimonas diminuta]|uniref:lasso peptide biosynthesis B2 protein n=1 Tax=Brevundimonas diminuta TaxID=293 RepID=UPI0020968392|nr:lasso peptide biosynthesis B2 protein [Brevundimonas diminuta]MCO8017916.1 lasso peptide biosynthesis B2 protein [Brevundimonas diminuta]MCO8021436.1 lasso peptide biosynthesis B2 protein [Brevundimonas diminuta]
MLIPSPGLHIARLDDDLVVLDLAQDAYFCLPGVGCEISRTSNGDWRPSGPDIATSLVNSGLFLRGAVIEAPTCAPLPVRTTRGMFHGSEASATDLLLLLAIWGREARRIHDRPVAALIRQSKRLERASADEAAVVDAVHLFERWSPLLPFQGLCLYRAYLLRAFLAAQGHGVNWVFGVRTWPFNAHCWLQLGDLLLDDDLDRVRLYTPILTVAP